MDIDNTELKYNQRHVAVLLGLFAAHLEKLGLLNCTHAETATPALEIMERFSDTEKLNHWLAMKDNEKEN